MSRVWRILAVVMCASTVVAVIVCAPLRRIPRVETGRQPPQVEGLDHPGSDSPLAVGGISHGVPTPSKSVDCDEVLEQQGVLRVLAKNSHHLPVEGAAIAVVDARQAKADAVRHGKTDDRGEAYILGLGAGPYLVTLSHECYAPYSQAIAMPTDRGARLVISLEQGAELMVSVQGARGEGVVGQEVKLEQYGDPRRTERSNADGVARFRHLRSGWCRIEVGGATGRAAIEASVTQGRPSTVVFRHGSELSGIVVTSSGHPIPEAALEVRQGPQRRHAAADAAGRYSIAGLPPGEASVRVSMEGADSFCTPSYLFEIAPGVTTHDVRLPPGEVSGIIVRADTKASIPSVNIYMAKVEPLNPAVELWLRSSSMGHFSAKGLPFGRYRLHIDTSAELNGLKGHELAIDLCEGSEVRKCEIPLEPILIGTLLVSVSNQDGRPVRGASFASVEGMMMRALEARVRTDGVYELNLGAGKRTVLVMANGLMCAVDVCVDAGRVTATDVLLVR